jgi:two-component system response regulator AtoC
MIGSAHQILIADDDRTIRRNLSRYLESEGYATREAEDGARALELIGAEVFDAVLLDLKMPGCDGLAVLRELGDRLLELPVIVLTAFGGSEPAIEAMRRGAYDYLAKPFDLEDVGLTLKRALRQRALAEEVRALRSSRDSGLESDAPPQAQELVGDSPRMREVFKAIGRAAPTDEPVLLLGESGTGKELAAWALHRHSRRCAGPFVRVNCAALPEPLVESELFGHERGAFTGADRQKQGRFERAQGGTLFLDEVGELPLSAQAKLLRAIQHHEYERVGGTAILRADARIISATHVDLGRALAAGRFREDLYYRLNVVRIVLPPLREHLEDLVELCRVILRRLEEKYGWRDLSLAPESLAGLRLREWPGNVRQLENVLSRAAIAARGRAILPEHLEIEEPQILGRDPDAPDQAVAVPLRALLAEVERRAIRQALVHCSGNRTRAAERLGISRRQLFEKIREYDLRI